MLTYPANSQPRNGCAIRVRSPTPRVVRSNTSPKKRHKHSNNSVAYPKSGTIDYFAQEAAQALQQLGRLPQEWYDQLLRPERDTSTPTTRSPTPRAARSTTLPKEGHKHSNNSIVYPKSGTIDYFDQRAAQTLQTTRSPTQRAKQAMAKQKKATRKDRAKLVHIIQRHLRRKERQDEACSHLKNSETKYITRTSKEG